MVRMAKDLMLKLSLSSGFAHVWYRTFRFEKKRAFSMSERRLGAAIVIKMSMGAIVFKCTKAAASSLYLSVG